MIIPKISHNGDTWINVPADSSTLNKMGIPPEVYEPLIQTLEVEKALNNKKQQARKQIHQDAGDDSSLLGTTTDGVQLLLYAFSKLTVALNTANSIEEVRMAAEPFNELATSFLGKIEAGDVKLPFQTKGLDNVVSDIENRATAVSNVLEKNQQNNNDTTDKNGEGANHGS